MGRLLIFFLGGAGGKRTSKAHNAETFSQDDASSKQPCVYVIYYMLSSGGFAAACLRSSRRGSSILDCPGQTRALLRLQQPVDLVHVLKTVKGLLLLVPPRTPRSSGYDVYAHAVYVAICYMSLTCICLLYVVICYMSVICLLYV